MTTTIETATFADQVAGEHGWTVLAEYGGHARTELHYFLTVKTPVGVLESTITRDKDRDRKYPDTSCTCSRFVVASSPEHPQKSPWQHIAALGYCEIGARELSPVKDPDENAMRVLRADALLVILRAVILLTAAQDD
jgi:hypothetical protein